MIGHTVISVDEVSSTNDLARDLLERPDADGIAVLAGGQTKGRGRLGRAWFSPAGKGIYLSVILRRPLHGDITGLLCPAASLAVAKTIESLSGINVLIKWPNDLIINGKKVGGVLVERTGDSFIVGVGINLNTSPEEFPEEIRHKASSLYGESGAMFEKNIFCQDLFLNFERIFSSLTDETRDNVLEEVKSRSFTLGKTVTVSDADRVFTGEAVGFESDGSLLLKDANGKIVNIKSGEIL